MTVVTLGLSGAIGHDPAAARWQHGWFGKRAWSCSREPTACPMLGSHT